MTAPRNPYHSAVAAALLAAALPTVAATLLVATTPAVTAAQARSAIRNQPRTEPRPTPRTEITGPVLEIDFPDVHIGIAEYDEGPTGATVFYFPRGVAAAVDVRGGAPGTVGTDFLRLGYHTRFIDAIVFAGGSSYGLSAATGAAQAIRERRDGTPERGRIATVPGAIIFDVGPRRFSMVVPDEALGAAALRAAEPGRFPLGAAGAGRFAMQSGYFDTRRYPRAGGFADARQHSGQGAAMRQSGATRVAVFTVVNSLGAVVDRSGQVVRCATPAAEGGCGSVSQLLLRSLGARTPFTITGAEAEPDGEGRAGATEFTTLTLVVTNQRLDFWALQRLATQVHTSMGRAIQPFHTERDGDVLFAVSTGEIERDDLSPVDLGVLAAEVAWDAVLASVPPLPDVDTTPATVDAAALRLYEGRYEFAPEVALVISRDGDRLVARAAGPRPVYGFTPDERSSLRFTASGQFISDNVRRDRLAFDRDASGRVVGVTLNPGRWALPGRRTD